MKDCTNQADIGETGNQGGANEAANYTRSGLRQPYIDAGGKLINAQLKMTYQIPDGGSGWNTTELDDGSAIRPNSKLQLFVAREALGGRHRLKRDTRSGERPSCEPVIPLLYAFRLARLEFHRSNHDSIARLGAKALQTFQKPLSRKTSR